MNALDGSVTRGARMQISLVSGLFRSICDGIRICQLSRSSMIVLYGTAPAVAVKHYQHVSRPGTSASHLSRSSITVETVIRIV